MRKDNIMSGSEIVQIVSLVLTATVSIVGLLVRARIIALEGEIKELNAVITSANALILRQGNIIEQMNEQIVQFAAVSVKRAKDEPYSGSPPYRKP